MLIRDGFASAADWDRLHETMTLPRLDLIYAAADRTGAEPVGGFEDFIRSFAPDGKAVTIR